MFYVFGSVWIILIFVSTALLKVAKLQHFSLAPFKMSLKRLCSRTRGMDHSPFLINMLTARKVSVLFLFITMHGNLVHWLFCQKCYIGANVPRHQSMTELIQLNVVATGINGCIQKK